MKRIFSCLIVLCMLLSCIPALSEDAQQPEIKATVKNVITVDGLQFKDLNDNGELDVYEDWRADIEDRITDLLSQMTLKEKSMLLYHICTCSDNTGVDFTNPDTLYKQDGPYDERHYSMWYHINVFGITDYLDNSNGTPDEQVFAHNEIQSMAEGTRLGVPVTFSSDREFNAWGGYIDTPHSAFGTAGDVELSKKLWESYSAQTRAVGYHVIFQPYGVELSSFNGEDPAYIADMTTAEVTALNAGGAMACVKHFISRTGFGSDHSEAWNVDNYMVGWKAAIEAGAQWIMTNSYGKGLEGNLTVDYDYQTLPYLRNELGYEGVILTDWGSLGNDYGTQTEEIAALSIPGRYAWVINSEVDQMGAPGAGATIEETLAATGPGILYVDGIKEAVEQGLITEERLEESARRILRTKFALGLFENPYSDGDAALALSASDAFIAEKWPITDNESLAAARKPEEVELERQLMTKSAVLVKNDGDLLPLQEGISVYVDSTLGASALEGYKKYIANYATVVESMEEADVVVADCSQFNDSAEMIVEDAQDAGKKLVLIANCVSPDAWAIENGDAVLALNFSRTADHGTGVQGINTRTEPDVLADMLFGVRQPEGSIAQEIARDSAMSDAQWKDLAGDMGLDPYTRLILEAIMLTAENNVTPNNWGDPLLQYKYGMRYGQHPEFAYSALVLPKVQKEVTTEGSSGPSTSVQTVVETKAGVPFEVYCLMWNNGDDGITTVQALVDGEVNAEKIMAINGGDWRVLKMEITIDQPGEHTVTVGDITKTINIAE
ncbi:MAG: glycoside hydrolase family 3 protein [Clostridia bacterium]|nr:glycoside hydrolase family 3 protein [Clostridia bacterium]